MSHLKAARTSAKRTVTRQINLIKQLVAEGDVINVDDDVIKLKEFFKKFTQTHNEYSDTLTEDEDIDESDTYFYHLQSDYISALDLTKGLDKHNVKIEAPSFSNAAEDLSRNDLLRLVNLPKVQLEIFDGNPLHFHQFMRAFQINVDKIWIWEHRGF